MNAAQWKARLRIEKALDHAHKVGLRGGVYEGKFRVWPEDGPNPADREAAGGCFFEAVEELGGTCYSHMILDGGAGN